MPSKYKIIDLFAGPGGLGEGFSAYIDEHGKQPFKIAISIEKELSAHATLTLRAFYRQFPIGEAPRAYYDFLKGKLGKTPEDILYKLPEFKNQVKAAKLEARCMTLGEDNKEIDEAIKKALGNDKRDCILIGGPPCQAYSVVGRSRQKGVIDYDPEFDKRNFLYKEYLRIIASCDPAVFVMENVKGMLSAKVSGENVFEKILADLSNPRKSIGKGSLKYKIVSLVSPPFNDGLIATSYNPNDFVIKMENHGIPQARHRVILLGLREDLAERWNSSLLLEEQPFINVKQIIGGLPSLRSGLSKEIDTFQAWQKALASIKGTVLKEIKDIGGIELSREVSSAIMSAESTPDSRGQNFAPAKTEGNLFAGMSNSFRYWYQDPKKEKLLCNHETRGHIRGDLHRYMFCAAWAKSFQYDLSRKSSPKPEDYPKSLIPKHMNFHSGNFSDRFRVQIEIKYATTITSHISKDGHYFIHYDPAQCRSLTVREAARIQTFPDNYFFLGNRTQQYVQVGNAVPPLLSKQIAEIVSKVLKNQN
jgi:DNA (cytosine-5)-methyltransferase 1